MGFVPITLIKANAKNDPITNFEYIFETASIVLVSIDTLDVIVVVTNFIF